MKKYYLVILFLGLFIALNAQQAFKTTFDFTSWPTEWEQQTLAKDGGWRLFGPSPASNVVNAGFVAGGDWSYAYSADVLCQCDKSEDLLILPGTYTAGKTWVVHFEYFFPGMSATNIGSKENLALMVSLDGKNWKEMAAFKPTFDKDWHAVTTKVALPATNLGTDFRMAIRYSDGGGQGYGVAIDNLAVVPAGTKGIFVKRTEPGQLSAWAGQDRSVELEITNLGDQPVDQLTTLVFSEEAIVVESVSDEALQPMASRTLRVDLPVKSPGEAFFQIGVQAGDGSGVEGSFSYRDEKEDDWFLSGFDVLDVDLVGLEMGTVDFGILGEEATGTWCGWCPRGAVFMDLMAEKYSDFIPVAVHNSDPMVNTEYDSWMAGSVGGFPSGHVQRRSNDVDPSTFEQHYKTAKTFAPAADLSMNFTYDQVTRKLDVTLTATYLANALAHRMNVILTEDGVKGTGNGWAQANYYAGGGAGVMGGYEKLPNPVPATQMVYDHVARALLATPFGTDKALPFQVKKDSTYTYTFSYTVPNEWKAENLHVIGVLHNHGNKTINNVKSSQLLSSSTETLPEGVRELQLFPNPSADGVAALRIRMDQPQTLQVEILDLLGRSVARRDFGVQSGDQVFPIVTGDLTPGIYTVRVMTGAASTTRQLVVAGR